MYTYVHSRYTAQYAAALAKEAGLPDEQVERIMPPDGSMT